MNKYTDELIATAKLIATPGKGILAADESTGTIGKRLASINVENTLKNRTDYRELLFRTKGLSQYISGCITYEETLFADAADGTPLVDLLKKGGIVPGIKVDMGVRPLYGTDGETVTQGMTGLADRCKKYYERGARFAKWRAVLHIKPSGAPSQLAINQNAETLARYAAICQANGLVPIVEPEVLMDGEHSIMRSGVTTEKVLAACVKALSDHHVMLEGCLLKPNMVRDGSDFKGTKATAEEIGRATVRILQHTIPVSLPSINFLSGGMSEQLATEALNEMNKQDLGSRPWSLSFSYGRALQQSCLKAWQGKPENVEAAQKALLHRAKLNGLANLGKYEKSMEDDKSASESLHVKDYTY